MNRITKMVMVGLAGAALAGVPTWGQTRPAPGGGGGVGDVGIVKTGTAADVAAAHQADTQRAATKQTLAVLSFIAKGDADKALAEKMRFAVSQKMGRDPRFVRDDNVEVDQAISALQVTLDTWPSDDDLEKIVGLLDRDLLILGKVEGRTLTLRAYRGGKLDKEVSGPIPDAKESPRQAVEKLLADLVQMRFVVRDVEADHSDPQIEKNWLDRPNLVLDPDFELAVKDKDNQAQDWGAVLGPKRWHPAIATLGEAEGLGEDQVAVVPKAASGVPGAGDGVRGLAGVRNESGSCLMMRMSKNTAENNGLACESTWVPVEDGKRYRFAVRYHSTGPTPRLFIKGFAVAPDQFGDKNDPEAVRREYYRAQVLPRHANKGWGLIEMDFTPKALEKYADKKIQWVRVDLYIYLQPGDVFFDQVQIKKIERDER